MAIILGLVGLTLGLGSLVVAFLLRRAEERKPKSTLTRADKPASYPEALHRA